MPYRLNEQGDMVWDDTPQTYEQRTLARQPLSSIDPAQGQKSLGDTLKDIFSNVSVSYRNKKGGGVSFDGSRLKQGMANKEADKQQKDNERYQTENYVAKAITDQVDAENKVAVKKREEETLKDKTNLAKLIAEQIATGKTGKGLVGQPVNSEWGVQPQPNEAGFPSGPQTTAYNQEGAQRTTLGQMENVQVPQTPAEQANQIPNAVAATQAAFAPEKQKEPSQADYVRSMKRERVAGIREAGGSELVWQRSLPPDQFDEMLAMGVIKDLSGTMAEESAKIDRALAKADAEYTQNLRRYQRLSVGTKANNYEDALTNDEIEAADPQAWKAKNEGLPTRDDFLNENPTIAPETYKQLNKTSIPPLVGTSGQEAPAVGQSAPQGGTPSGYVSPEQEAAINQRLAAIKARIAAIEGK